MNKNYTGVWSASQLADIMQKVEEYKRKLMAGGPNGSQDSNEAMQQEKTVKALAISQSYNITPPGPCIEPAAPSPNLDFKHIISSLVSYARLYPEVFKISQYTPRRRKVLKNVR